MNSLNSHQPARSKVGLFTVFGLCLVLSFSLTLAGTKYEFDDNEKKDMQSAWLMCALTGFVKGECPSVFRKCWLPPLTWLRRHRTHFHIETHCTKIPFWDTSDSEVKGSLEYAASKSPEADAYNSGAQDYTNVDLVPQICLDNPELCPTAADEANYFKNDRFGECSENPDIPCKGDLPPICEDNPELCEEPK